MNEVWDVDSLIRNLGEALGCRLTYMPRKRVLFWGRRENGEKVVVYAPRAKLQPQGFWWIDLSVSQYEALEEGDEGILVFRLDGGALRIMKWPHLREKLRPELLKHSMQGGNHWSLYIYPDYISINGGPVRVVWDIKLPKDKK